MEPEEPDLSIFSEIDLLEFVLEILEKQGPISNSDRTLLYSINEEFVRRENARKRGDNLTS